MSHLPRSADEARPDIIVTQCARSGRSRWHNRLFALAKMGAGGALLPVPGGTEVRTLPHKSRPPRSASRMEQRPAIHWRLRAWGGRKDHAPSQLCPSAFEHGPGLGPARILI